jgi:hypothetical protein
MDIGDRSQRLFKPDRQFEVQTWNPKQITVDLFGCTSRNLARLPL